MVCPWGPGPVRLGGGFHLENPEVNPHLDHLAAARGLHEAGLNDTRLVIPPFQDEIDILIHYAHLWFWDHPICFFYLSLKEGGFAMETACREEKSA